MRHSRTHRGHGRGHHPAGEGPFRVRHGDVRAALLLALEAGPAHGYELGQRLEQLSGGAWRPSPGSIYPTLQTLADEDCVTSEERDGKRVYTLAKQGTGELRERQARGETAPWLAPGGHRNGALREAVVALKLAAEQIAAAGNPTQNERAVEIVTDARRRLYDLLSKA